MQNNEQDNKISDMKTETKHGVAVKVKVALLIVLIFGLFTLFLIINTISQGGFWSDLINLHKKINN